MRVRECNGWGRPAVSTLADGTLIYPTITGIALLDATALETPELSPLEIYVDRAWTGDREIDPGRSLELAAGDRHLGLRFGALGFLRQESVAFRYRLEGAHADWLAAGRRTEAVYSHLKPGRYRFEVQARLPGQDWVGMAQPILVAVAPRLVERPGFRIAAVALLLAGALVANRWWTRVERAHAQAIAQRAGVPMPGLIEEVKKKVNRPVPDLALSDEESPFTLTTNATAQAANGKSPAPRAVVSLSDAISHFQLDAPMCPNCGHVTVRNGACYKCLNCGEIWDAAERRAAAGRAVTQRGTDGPPPITLGSMNEGHVVLQVFLSLVGFVVFWLLVLWLIALFTGWRSLAKRYRSQRPMSGKVFRGCSVGLGRAGGYNGCIRVTFTPRGIHVVPMLFFRFGHPPLLLPWELAGEPAEQRVFRWWIRHLPIRTEPRPLRMGLPAAAWKWLETKHPLGKA